MIAKNYADFTNKATTVIMNALNTTEGKKLTNALLKESLKKNPHLTAEEWSRIKAQFMVFMFKSALDENPELMHEFAHHAYNMYNAN